MKKARLLQILVLVVLIAAAALAVWPLQRFVSERMEFLKNEAISFLERTTGRKISYDSVSPSVLRFLEIKKMRILSETGEGDDLLEINRIRIYYNIFKLIGKNPGSAFSRVSIEDSTLLIDLVEDKDLIDLVKSLADQLLSEEKGEINLILSGRNMNVTITNDGTEVAVSDLFFDVNAGGEQPAVDLAGELSCVLPGLGDQFKEIAATLDLTGTFSRDMSKATLIPSVSGLTAGDFTLAEQTFQLFLSSGLWRLAKIQDRLPLDFSLSWDTGTNVVEAAYAAAAFVPSTILTYSGDASTGGLLPVVLASRVSGEGRVTYDPENKALSYRGSIDAALPDAVGPFSNIKARGTYAGDLKEIKLSQLVVSSDQGTVELDGYSGLFPFSPQGTVKVTDLSWPLDRLVSGVFSVSAVDHTVMVHSGKLEIDRMKVEALEAEILIASGAVSFRTGFVVGENGRNRITAEGSVLPGDPPEIEISQVSVRDLPLSLLTDLAGIDGIPAALPAELFDMEISASAFIQAAGGRYLFSAPAFSAVAPGGGSRITARISGNNNTITVSDLAVLWGGLDIKAKTTIDISDPDNLRIGASVNMLDTDYSIEGVLDRRRIFTFSGDYGLAGFVSLKGPEYTAELHTRNLPIPYRGITYHAALHLTGRYADNSDWRLQSIESSFGPVRLPVLGEIQAGFTGSVTPNLVTAERIRILDQHSELVGNGYLAYEISGDRALTGEVSLENSADNERYAARFAVDKEMIDAQLTVTGGLLQRAGNFPLGGRLSGQIIARGPLSFPDLSATLSLEEGTFAGDAVSAALDVTLDENELRVENVNLDYVNNRITNGSGSLSFAKGTFSLAASFASSFRDRIVTSGLLFSGGFDRLFKRNEIGVVGEAGFSASLTVGDIVFGDENPDDWVFDIVRSENAVTIDGGPQSAVSFVAKKDRSFVVEFFDPLPIVATARGVLSAGEIDAELLVTNLDMEGIESILVIPFFNITSGKAYGSLLVSGRLNDPDIYGDLYGRELLANIRVVPEIIGPFSAQLSFKGKNLLINRTLLPAGAADVYGTAEFTLDHWLPSTFSIQLTTASEPGIHIRNNFGKVETDGYGRGELLISGDPFAVEVTGEMLITEGTVMIGESPPKSKGGTPVIADVRLTTGKKVVFLWPNRTIPILTAYADTGQNLRIQANPLINSLDIDGEIQVKSGEVFYFQRGFRIKEGSVLLEEDQNAVDPRISVRAESRDISDKGEEVRIYLVIENQPFSQFRPRFESVPSMSQTEIYAALGQNLRDEFGGDFYGISSALLITSDIFSQFGVMRTLEQRVRDLLNLDLFSIRTHILQNVLSEQLIPADTAFVPLNPSAGRYLDNTTLFLGKYFGNDIFIEAMVRLRVNQALLSNVNAGDDLYVDSEIRLEWKTPLFLLELSLLPDILDPLSSIKRARLGLSWDIWY
ncbi:MAG: translocation/assembly module TamB domain-containing protein [Spirochaetales bacterium]|nr:translocation/assembly module TamB domain-containing protein [Spirochaetales bacterium]